MLKYFVMTVESLALAALITGALRGISRLKGGRTGGIIAGVGSLAGVIGAAVMAYLKNATKLIDTSMWNLYIFGAFACLTVLFLLFAPFSKKLGKAGSVILAVLCALMCGLILFYALPDVIAYPYSILVTDKSVLSTSYLFKLIGALFGVIAMVLVELAVRNGTSRLGEWQAYIIAGIMTLVTALRQVGAMLGIMLTKAMLTSLSPDTKKTVFEIVKTTSNNSNYFIYGAMAAALVIPVIVFIRSLDKSEPYDNPAQKRKIVKRHKVSRRWAVLAVLTVVLSFCSFTVLEPIANRPVELSPVEECEERDGYMCLPFEKVDDGHLHRFAYVAPSGIQIRFIVIKKPNSSSYGIGLDACDVCGETGYYEKDGQVVCKLCDVVMNISTIGFKGGCNPIVIPYEVKDGEILVPIEGLMEYEKTFRNNRMASGGI